MVKRKIDTQLYIMVLFITISIFIAGLFLGGVLSQSKLNSLSEDLESLERMRNTQETNSLLLDSLDEKICLGLESYINEMLPEIESLAERVAYYERSADSKRFGIKEYDDIKKDYNLLLIRYWIITNKLEKNCGKNIMDILYFYSNKKCDNCKDQGIYLDSIKKQYPEIMIFALDKDLNLSTIDILSKSFNITEVPSLIINGNNYSGLKNKEEIIELITQETK
ncbi:MAG: hypothetical protein DRP06_01750 [Candidatus Aenigmatarchaeota archaeon]|nr:MAG: hypothetical protein DRP06_01750 [Candidatus Aenigmarchaeota archaeon]